MSETKYKNKSKFENKSKIKLIVGINLALAIIVAVAIILISNIHEKEIIVSVPEVEKQMYLDICIDSMAVELYKVKKDETLTEILAPHNIPLAKIYALSDLSPEQFDVRGIKTGNKYALLSNRADSTKTTAYFIYQRNLAEFVICSLADSLCIRTFKKEIRTELRELNATIESSMYMAIKEAGAPDGLTAMLANIYQWSIDFYGIQKHDSFSVLYEQQFVDSISIGIKNIKAAKFTHSRIPYYAIGYIDGNDEGFWDDKGESLRKSFLKAPLNFSRISSKFSNHRMHPVLRVVKPHHGVDYAAPSGTPVWSVADGIVTYRKNSGAGGLMIKIKHSIHNGRYVTGYLHLKAFAKGLKVGSRVKQGEIIGYVGSTGRSTGPHLDYRIWKNGKAINPLNMTQEKGTPISNKFRAPYTIYKDSMVNILDSIKPNISGISKMEIKADTVQIEKTKVS